MSSTEAAKTKLIIKQNETSSMPTNKTTSNSCKSCSLVNKRNENKNKKFNSPAVSTNETNCSTKVNSSSTPKKLVKNNCSNLVSNTTKATTKLKQKPSTTTTTSSTNEASSKKQILPKSTSYQCNLLSTNKSNSKQSFTNKSSTTEANSSSLSSTRSKMKSSSSSYTIPVNYNINANMAEKKRSEIKKNVNNSKPAWKINNTSNSSNCSSSSSNKNTTSLNNQNPSTSTINKTNKICNNNINNECASLNKRAKSNLNDKLSTNSTKSQTNSSLIKKNLKPIIKANKIREAEEASVVLLNNKSYTFNKTFEFKNYSKLQLTISSTQSTQLIFALIDDYNKLLSYFDMARNYLTDPSFLFFKCQERRQQELQLDNLLDEYNSNYLLIELLPMKFNNQIKMLQYEKQPLNEDSNNSNHINLTPNVQTSHLEDAVVKYIDEDEKNKISSLISSSYSSLSSLKPDEVVSHEIQDELSAMEDTKRPRPSYIIERDQHIFGGCVDEDASDEFFISSGAVFTSWPYVYEPGFQMQRLIDYVPCKLFKSLSKLDLLLSESNADGETRRDQQNHLESEVNLPCYWLDNFEINLMHAATNSDGKKKNRRGRKKKSKKQIDSFSSSYFSCSAASQSQSVYDEEEDKYTEDDYDSSDSESIIEYKKRHAIGLNNNRLTRRLNNLNMTVIGNVNNSSSSITNEYNNTSDEMTSLRATHHLRMTSSFYHNKGHKHLLNSKRIHFLSQKRIGQRYFGESQTNKNQAYFSSSDHLVF